MSIVKQNFPVTGMSCASCVAHVEKALKGVEGVKECSVSLASNTAQVDYDPSLTSPGKLRSAVQGAGYDLITDAGEDERQAEEKAEEAAAKEYSDLRRDTIGAAILAVTVMAVSMALPAFSWKGYLLWGLATVAVFVFGRRFIVSAYRQLRHGTTGMDTLVALSMLISYFFSVFNLLFPTVWTSKGLSADLYFESSSMIGAFILIGRLLENRTKRGTSASIRALMSLQPSRRDIAPGDVFTVKPGESIAADGKVVSGNTYIDESMLTGESVPAFKQKGDSVYAGTINQKGTLEVMAEKVGTDTMLSSIIKMVKDAQGSKARIQNIVDRVAAVFVPVIIGISILSLLLWIILDPADGVTHGLLAMVTVLVIACPCSLGLATPTALIAGIGNGARKGILIKDADSLQIACKVDTVVMDKTGTLTKGHPVVTDEKWFLPQGAAANLNEAKRVLLSMEERSDHPLAAAIVEYLRGTDSTLFPVEPDSFENVPGQGILASFSGREYFIGNKTPREEAEWLSEGKTVVYFTQGDSLLAEFAISDEVKEGSAKAVSELKGMGVNCVMLTGDKEAPARYIASQVGIEEVKAGVKPDEKALYIKELQQSGKKVAMVGDGINDSAALSLADLSIAMGKGSDIAISSAMATIVSNDLQKIPQLLALSRKTVRVIKENLFWAFFYNMLAVPIAAGVLYPINGFLLNPMIAAACMALSSVCVVLNSLRLR